MVIMDKKIMLVALILLTFCLVSTVSASSPDDAVAADENVEIAESAQIDSISQSESEPVLSSAPAQTLADNDTGASEEPSYNSIEQTTGVYIGGNGNDKGKGVYTDAEGNIYLAMETNSNDLQTTEGAYQANISGGKDLFVSKYTAAGDLIYATYIGGSTTEMQKDLKVDSLGNVYVIGFTNSANFPVTENAFQKVINGSQDAFLTVLNPEGTDLVYSTYLGGDVVDRAWALAIDDNGSAYIQGITNSINFPVTDNAYQKSKDGVNWSLGDPDDIDYQNSFDLFLSKININSGELEYSTFFGAKGSDSTYGSVAVDKNEVIYFAGTTTSLDFPVTENAYRDVRAEQSDSFLSALDIRNNKLLFSSYIGGNSTDDGEAIVLSENGFLYYVGDTWSENFPTTEGAYQTEFAGVGESISGGDMFIMKIDTSNWELVYATLLGGKFDEGVRALAVDSEENAWVVGMSQSDDYPVTDDAYQKIKNGPQYISYANSTDYDYPTHDTVISKISPDGSKLLYSTYYGGNSGEFAMGITFANGGFILQIRTCSDDLNVTDGSKKGQDQFNGSLLGHDPVYDFDSYLAVFKNPTIIEIEDVSADVGSAVNLTATVKQAIGNAPLADKEIAFYVDGTLAGKANTDENGVATLTYAPRTAISSSYSAVFEQEIGHAVADASASIDVAFADVPTVTLNQTVGIYIGGNGNDKGKGVYTDAEGNIYLAMETNSNDLQTTEGAYQANISGGKDLFVSKYSPNGELIYATYIGGSATEMQKDLKVDSQGNVYVIGFTNSANFPVTENAFQKVVNGSQDAFLTVLNPEGTGLVYSTYLGGDVVDRAWALAIDDNGTAYIQGITNSINFPVTADAYQKTKDGVNWSLGDPDDIDYQNSFDLFLSKININSGELEYSTFFGAKGSDSTYGSVAVDKNEVIYFAGTTTSLDFPVTDNAFRDVRAEQSDSFLSALDIRNNKLLFSSYIGGNSTDDGEAIVLSENGFLYYVGDTWSENFPTTEGAYQTAFAGVGESISGGDMFIMKIDTSNWELVYATLLGGKFDEGVRALAVDSEENAWVVGMSQSHDYPVTSDAFQRVKNGPKYISYANSTDYDYPTHDTVISKISPDGSKLLYSTYFGGNSGEFAMGITFTEGGFILQIRTCSDDLYVTDNSTKGQDQFNGSLLGHDPVYDFDSYLAVFENPTIIEVENITAKMGETVNLTATVKQAIGSAPLANKYVEFYVGNTLIGNATIDENGVATLTYSATSPMSDTYTAVFKEAVGHAAANASASIDIAFYDVPTVDLNNASAIIQKYGTYLGGNGFDKGKAAFVDKDGNIYVAMESNSRDYVTTPWAFQSTMNGARDIVVAKFTKDGELVYLTYFGGRGNEMHKDFKVDADGNAYVVGFTNSPDFPVTENAIKKNLTGIQNAFLAVFDSEGNLTFSTLIGGENVDRAFAVALDEQGNAYVQGITNSPDFPVTADAFQPTKNGPVWNNTMSSADITFQDSFDLFITKINVKDAKIEYSTFFGGETMDTTEGTIDVDKNGIIYFGGYTSALLLNVTENAFQKEFQGKNDAFLTVLDPVNKKLVYSTYVGGEDDDIGGEVVVSDDGYLYYVGDTWSKQFPVSDNAYQKEFKGAGNDALGGDAFIIKMNTTDWSIIYSTYFGGTGDDGIGDLEIDEEGNLYLLFSTESTDFPVTDDAYQLEKNGLPYGPATFDNDYPTFDSAVVKFSGDGSEVLYSTYFGGSSGEQAFGFALNQGGFVLFIRTYSNDMFVTDDAYQLQHGNDSVSSRYGRTLNYMDNYLGIFVNPTTVTVEDITATVGSVDLVATVTEAMGNNPIVNKSVDFYIDGVLVGSALTDENGIAKLAYEISDVKNMTYSAVYNETLTHAAAEASADITTTQQASELADLTVSKDLVVSGVLKDAQGNPVANETINYAINGVNASVKTGEDGSFAIPSQNNAKLEISFPGSDNLAPTKLSLTFDDVATAASRQATVIEGNNFTQNAIEYSAGERGGNFTVQLKDANGNILANKTVLIGYNGKTLERTTDAEGYATVQINLRDANRLTFATTFLGDEEYNATMSVYLITITKKPVTITAAAKTYKATAKTKKYTVTLKTVKGASADGKTYFKAGKKVTLKVNGKTYTAKTNAKGQATFSLKITKKGKFTAKVSYAGDTTYNAAKKSVKITIK